MYYEKHLSPLTSHLSPLTSHISHRNPRLLKNLKKILQFACAFLLLAVNFNCQVDEEKTIKGLHNSSETISKNQLLSELSHPYLLSFLKSNGYKPVESNAQMRVKESSDEFQKIIFPNQYTTYTYKIPTYNPLKPSIKHLVITKDSANVEKACYVLYTPSTYTFTVNLKTFSGKIETFTLENKLLSRTDYVNGKPINKNSSKKTASCYDVILITTVYCSGNGSHGVGEMCDVYNKGVVVGQTPSDAYYEFTTRLVCRPDGPPPATIDQPTNFGAGGGFGGSGVAAFEGIPMPVPFTGDGDLSNDDDRYADSVLEFTKTLTNVQSRMAEHYWLFPNILEWTKRNGKLTDQNKNAIAFTLEHIAPILDLEETPTRTRIEVNQLYYKAFMFLLQSPRLPAATFVSQFAQNSKANPDLKLDFDASWRSPANIDFSAIDNNTPEGARFNEVYKKLENVPEFKALFVDIFGGTQTDLNVKFEIRDNLAEASPPYRPAAGKCVPKGSNNYVILINKQTLLPLTGTMPFNKLENSQTIVHEAIHAYLRNLLSNPNSIATIDNINQLDLEGILAALKVLNSNQHDIMFEKLTETMEKIIKSLKNILTTPEKRTQIESYTINESQTQPYNPQLWNWDTYFRYLSFIGLEDTPGFKALFPPNSDALSKYNDYIATGRAILNY